MTHRCRISLARWPEDNFDKMIKIMQNAVEEARNVVMKAKHHRAVKKQQVKSYKKV